MKKLFALFVMASLVGVPSLSVSAQDTDPVEAAKAAMREKFVLGNRAELWAKFPGAQPDPDWRTVLAPWLRGEFPEWSQGFEELIIRDHFRDIKGGFFLDVGCAGPERHSTTNYLETVLHWKGIGIDVNDRFAPLWEKKRPNSKFICKAIYDTDGEVLTLHIAGYIRSLDKDVAGAFSNELNKIREVDVTTITLNTLLEENGVEKVDFLSLDIEGAEMGALRGFDIQKYRPDLCCVETRQYEAVNDYFERNGYELIEKYRKADKINVYYQPKPQTDSASETSPEKVSDDSVQKMDSTNNSSAEVSAMP